MARRSTKVEAEDLPPINLSLDPDVRANQLAAMAETLVARRILQGTASSQELLYCLKQADVKRQLELEQARHQNALLEAKTAAIKSAASDGELYKKAIDAMRRYSGQTVEPPEDYDDD